MNHHRPALVAGFAVASAIAAAFVAHTAAPPAAAIEPLLGGASVSTTIVNGSGAAVTSVSVGTAVHDTVRVAGPLGTPTGTVTVSFFSNGTCANTAASSWTGTLGQVTLGTAGADITASTVSPAAPGSVSYRAKYNGNATYAAVTGACEPLTVTKAKSTVATFMATAAAKVTKVSVGTSVFMHVTVSGAIGTPTGTVQVEEYDASSTCSPTAHAQLLNLTNGSVVSPAFNLPAGTYSFRAIYLGNTVYAASVGPCMPFEWAKVKSTVMLDVFGSNLVDFQPIIGNPARGIVAVTGSIGTPTGTVTINSYAGTDCSGFARPFSLTLAGGTVDSASTGHTELETAPTFRSWTADYSGDASYLPGSSGCKVVHWRASATLAAKIDDASGHVVDPNWGSTSHIFAEVIGSFGAATGDVALHLYTGGTCGAGLSTATQGLVNGQASAIPPDLGTLEPGSYSVILGYVPDDASAYLATTTSCEPFNVARARVTIGVGLFGTNGTAEPLSFPIGTTVHPRVTIASPAGLPPGTIRVRAFSEPDCNGTAIVDATTSVTAGTMDLPSIPFTPTSAGSMSYQASYAQTVHFDDQSACQNYLILAAGATPPPTPIATARPSGAPGPTSGPGAPTATGPVATGSTATDQPGSSTIATGSVAPGATLTAGQSPGPVAVGGGPEGTTPANPEPGVGAIGSPEPGASSIVPIALGIVLVAGSLVAGWVVGRRRRPSG